MIECIDVIMKGVLIVGSSRIVAESMRVDGGVSEFFIVLEASDLRIHRL